MALLFKDLNKLSAYRDRRFPGNQEEFEEALKNSTTVYVGNMSFYTTEEQIYELFSRVGEIKKIIMGLDKNSKTPCGFCFVLYYSREDTEDGVKYISGTILDDRAIRVDFDWGFQEGRQWGRGRSGGQVRDEYRTDYDPGRGGYGKLVQKELEVQRQLVDYGAGTLGAFPPVVPSHYGGRHERGLVMEVPIGMVEIIKRIIIERGKGKTIVTLRCQRKPSVNQHTEIPTTNRDRRKTHVFVKVGTLMKTKMTIARIVLRLNVGSTTSRSSGFGLVCLGPYALFSFFAIDHLFSEGRGRARSSPNVGVNAERIA